MSRRYSIPEPGDHLLDPPISPQQPSPRCFVPSEDRVHTTQPPELIDYDDPVSPISPPVPPPHRVLPSLNRNPDNTRSVASNITSGADNFSSQAAGGMSGIAMNVAETHSARYRPDSGGHDQASHALSSPTPFASQHDYGHMSPYHDDGQSIEGYRDEHRHEPYYGNASYHPQHPTSQSTGPYTRPETRQVDSNSSLMPLAVAAAAPASLATTRSGSRFTDDPYSDSSFKQYSGNHHPGLGYLDPSTIEDDEDDGLEYSQQNSMLGQDQASQQSGRAAMGKGVAAGGVLGAFGGLVGRPKTATPSYGLVERGALPAGYEKHAADRELERSAWLSKQKKSTNKYRWLIGGAVALLILGGIGGGLAAFFINKKNNPEAASSSNSNGESAASDLSANGDLSASSAEIKALLNNKNLHKVFPGIDYTPMNTQYPDCLTNPPSQNNVTRDMAVLSQLTNQVRLYGTDCNQTEMVLHAINQLNLQKTVKVWLGVWQAKNATTNARQLSQMYSILETYGTSQFAGTIIGNECIFREDMPVTALEQILTDAKSNFTSKGYNLTVSTSDIGVSWTASLASVSDYLMSNIHPFFSGVPAASASAWTSSFFTTSMLALQPVLSKNIIAETGWPSGGGTDCGTSTVTTCANGSVAGIDGMNKFMGDWVCAALTNGTNYFMFEAFDEPWKASFNIAGEEWEDKWGLLDVNRNLKSGLSIPDCGGKTVPAVF